jgi:hypothetical protein
MASVWGLILAVRACGSPHGIAAVAFGDARSMAHWRSALHINANALFETTGYRSPCQLLEVDIGVRHRRRRCHQPTGSPG